MKYKTLTENYEFKRGYARGKSVVSPVLVTYAFKKRSGEVRIGITATKKIGNAVKRNRARRVIREAYQSFAPYIKGKYDIIFVARGKTPYVKMQQIERVMKIHLAQLIPGFNDANNVRSGSLEPV